MTEARGATATAPAIRISTDDPTLHPPGMARGNVGDVRLRRPYLHGRLCDRPLALTLALGAYLAFGHRAGFGVRVDCFFSAEAGAATPTAMVIPAFAGMTPRVMGGAANP